MKKNSLLLVALLFSFTTAFSQLGIRVGVNMANQIKHFGKDDLKKSFSNDNLTGFQVGLIYSMNRSSGLGFEVGALLAQKGGMFDIDDSSSAIDNAIEGYKEINYFEVPLNLKYKMNIIDPVSVFGVAGLYGGFAITEVSKVKTKIDDLKKSRDFDDFADRIDYGFNLGFGVELIEKIQIAFNWSQALQKKNPDKKFFKKMQDGGFIGNALHPNVEPKSTNRVFSVSLTYLL
ncbi:MAG: hypothetical protein CR965_00885 [Paludibacter sp.]|nr:MAG: hypothetical protein CR965_00885 [Paludibacter sp.]